MYDDDVGDVDVDVDIMDNVKQHRQLSCVCDRSCRVSLTKFVPI